MASVTRTHPSAESGGGASATRTHPSALEMSELVTRVHALLPSLLPLATALSIAPPPTRSVCSARSCALLQALPTGFNSPRRRRHQHASFPFRPAQPPQPPQQQPQQQPPQQQPQQPPQQPPPPPPLPPLAPHLASLLRCLESLFREAHEPTPPPSSTRIPFPRPAASAPPPRRILRRLLRRLRSARTSSAASAPAPPPPHPRRSPSHALAVERSLLKAVRAELPALAAGLPRAQRALLRPWLLCQLRLPADVATLPPLLDVLSICLQPPPLRIDAWSRYGGGGVAKERHDDLKAAAAPRPPPNSSRPQQQPPRSATAPRSARAG